MKLKNCNKCNNQPSIQTTEIGMLFRLVCSGCGKHTQDLISPSTDTYPDEDTSTRLENEWNNMN